MRIAVLGTGTVGRALAARLAGLGHEVAIGTRDVEGTLSRPDPPDAPGTSFAAWSRANPTVALATFAAAAAAADLVVNATSGQVTLDALAEAGAENLAGKVLVDISNPLDFSAGFPPTLFVKDTDSLGEQVQAAFPEARVVKTLNTLTAALMVHPELVGDAAHSVFMSGDDAAAKDVVRGLLVAMGHTDVIDLGGISTARGTEMFLALWVRTMQALGTPMFNVKIVR